VAPASPGETFGGAPGSVAEWLAALGCLEQWLAALDANNDQAPAHVVDAVRADYRARLREIFATADGRRAELERDRTAAAEAGASAADRRLELRLRYLVGEIDARGLDAGLDEQEEAIVRASREEQAHAQELAEVEAFIAQILDRFPEAGAPAEPGPSDPFGGDDDLGFLDILPASASLSREPSHGSPASRPHHSIAADSYLGSALPREQLVCRHCGTGNEASHWYCDGCGAELG
jgi:hypothetical protein